MYKLKLVSLTNKYEPTLLLYGGYCVIISYIIAIKQSNSLINSAIKASLPLVKY